MFSGSLETTPRLLIQSFSLGKGTLSRTGQGCVTEILQPAGDSLLELRPAPTPSWAPQEPQDLGCP